MNKLRPIYLSLISAALLIVGWPPLPTAFLLFVALVPVLQIREKLTGKRIHLRYFGYTYLTMFIFNTGTTWWVWNASPSGCIMMLLMNSLIMSLPFLAYSHTKNVFPKLSYLSFVLYYLCFEYWHFNWSASWPWLTFGKGLASMPFYIQWYEFTGEMGGSALILATNAMVSSVISKGNLKQLWKPASLLILFGAISFLTALNNFEIYKGNGIQVVITQPNIDPYEEKFGNGPNYLYPEIQLDYALEPAEPLIDENTDLLLMPETAIVGYNDEAGLKDNFLFEPLRKMTENTKLCVLTGAETFSVYKEKKRPSRTARFDSSSAWWFDYFNTAINVKKGKAGEIYHKSKLVPGVEKMPFEFLENLSIKLGGTSGSLGISDRPINFKLNDGTVVAPLICYESVFGDYASEYVNDGAQILAVVTNDGWWGETPGFKQHLLYGGIRCIETRREMIRSANTGVSAKINKFGKITSQTRYNERTAFKCVAKPNSRKTFYVKYGNLIGKTSILSILLLLSTFVRGFLNKKNGPLVI